MIEMRKAAVLLVAILLCIVGAAASAASNATEISYWSFDEDAGSTAADTAAAGHMNNGELINNPLWVPGWRGSAIQIDPGQYVEALNNGDSLSIPSGGVTISAWIRPADVFGEGVIVAKDKLAVSSRGNYFFEINQGHLQFGFSPQPTGMDVVIDSAEAVIVPGAWSFVAVTFNYGIGEKPAMYVNGAAVAVGDWQGSGDQANLPFTYPDPLYIGRSIDSGLFFDGAIDEVKIYSGVLTPEEIAAEASFIYLPLIVRAAG